VQSTNYEAVTKSHCKSESKIVEKAVMTVEEAAVITVSKAIIITVAVPLAAGQGSVCLA
jgi:hypothetical protein